MTRRAQLALVLGALSLAAIVYGSHWWGDPLAGHPLMVLVGAGLFVGCVIVAAWEAAKA